MGKNELYELRKRLLESKKYKKVNIEGSDSHYINLNILYNEHSYLEENIYGSYKIGHAKAAVDFLEKSCEKLIRILADNNISYDSINILLCPTFFMREIDIDNSVDDDYNIEKGSFRENMLIDNNLVEMSYLLSVQKDRKMVELDERINEYINKVANVKFLIDYNYFVRCVTLNGFPLEDYDYSRLIESQINNKGTSIKLDFEKEKTF